MNSITTVLVVGANGSIGRHVVAEALAAGYTTRALVRAGAHVEFSVRARQFTKAGAATGTVLCQLPEGYRPTHLYRTAALSPSAVQLDVSPDGTVKIVAGSITQNAYVTLRLTHITTDQEAPQ